METNDWCLIELLVIQYLESFKFVDVYKTELLEIKTFDPLTVCI